MNSEKFFKYWAPPILWALVIFLFSSIPIKPVSAIYWREFVVKKSLHIIEYGILASLIYRAIKNNGVDKRVAGYWTAIFASFYGVTDEFHQSFTPGREPTIRDVIFDTIGAVLAVYLIWKYLPKAPKRLKKLAETWELL